MAIYLLLNENEEGNMKNFVSMYELMKDMGCRLLFDRAVMEYVDRKDNTIIGQFSNHHVQVSEDIGTRLEAGEEAGPLCLLVQTMQPIGWHTDFVETGELSREEFLDRIKNTYPCLEQLPYQNPMIK